MKKWNIYVDNENGTAAEQCFRGCQGEDLKVFLERWLKMRKYLRKLTGNPDDLIMMDTRLFSGLHSYFTMMRSSMDQLEAHLRDDALATTKKSVNVTRCVAAVELGCVDDLVMLAIHEPVASTTAVRAESKAADGPVSETDMETWIIEENPEYFPAEQRKAHEAAKMERKRSQQRKRRERKKAAARDLTAPLVLRCGSLVYELCAEAARQGYIHQDENGDQYYVPTQFDDVAINV